MTLDSVTRQMTEEFLIEERLPFIFCAGCGIGIIIRCYIEAIQKAKLDRKSLVTVSGIGCTGRVSGYMNTDGFHTTHGRAIPFATGVKYTRPELNVVVFSGDGDLTSIGGNHLIHAARRNVDMTVLCANNAIYGMTGGQVAPTTPRRATTSTTPSPTGVIFQAMNLFHLAVATGATFVARYSVLQYGRLSRAITKALTTKGFSFVEIISPCPTLFGRKNKMGEPRVMYNAIKDITDRMTAEELADPKKARIVFSPEEGFLRIPTGEIEIPSEGFLRAEEEKTP